MLRFHTFFSSTSQDTKTDKAPQLLWRQNANFTNKTIDERTSISVSNIYKLEEQQMFATIIL